MPLRVLRNIPSRTPCRALPQLLPHSHPAQADIWWVSALGTASSLLYVFIALILGLIYSGNHLGSVGGRVGSSTSQKIFGIFSSLGNIAFAFGGWRGSACGWLLASKLAVCAAVGSQEPTVLPVYRAKCGIIPFHLARACRRLCPGAARDPGHASPAARRPEDNEEGGPRASAVQRDEQVRHSLHCVSQPPRPTIQLAVYKAPCFANHACSHPPTHPRCPPPSATRQASMIAVTGAFGFYFATSVACYSALGNGVPGEVLDGFDGEFPAYVTWPVGGGADAEGRSGSNMHVLTDARGHCSKRGLRKGEGPMTA